MQSVRGDICSGSLHALLRSPGLFAALVEHNEAYWVEGEGLWGYELGAGG